MALYVVIYSFNWKIASSVLRLD